MKFTELNLHPDLMKGIDEMGFVDCTDVQERTFAETLQGRDVAVQSQTGTGKTAAFLISIFQRFSETSPSQGDEDAPARPKMEKRKALIVVPTRELAVQIEAEAKQIGKHLDLRIGSFFGGVGYKQQEALLADGVDIFIGTPGRLLDFQHSKKIDFSGFGVVVIDEADRLFDMGFLPDLRRMIKVLPTSDLRQTMLFSATLTSRVRNLAWEYMAEAVEIEVDPETVTVEDVTQELYHVSASEKMGLLLGILKKENPENAILFTNTKLMAVELAKRLGINGYNAHYLMGDLPQKKRLAVIDRVKRGEIKFLVATDVAARGLHVEDLDMVINYDVPEDAESYVHRIGRTARAGKNGKAVTLACEKFVFGLESIEKFIGDKIPVAWADEGLFQEDKSAGMRIDLDRYGSGPRGRDRDRGRGDRRDGGHRGGRRGGGPHRQGRSSGDRHHRDKRHGEKEALRRVQSAVSEAAGRVTHDERDRQRRQERRPDDQRSRQPAGSGSRKGGRNDQRRRQGNQAGDGRNRQGRGSGSGAQRSTPRKDNGQSRRRSSEAPRKPKGSKLEDRIEYYKQKYGEDFKVSPEMLAEEKSKKKGLFGRIFGSKKK